jgi:hypothetical protein
MKQLIIDNDFYYKMAVSCKNSYTDNIDLGTTEFNLSSIWHHKEIIQVLSIPGTNEMRDWIKNFDLRSTEGIKKHAQEAAREIVAHPKFHKKRNNRLRLVVNGHSKGGAEAIAFNKLFKPSYCTAFAPAPCLKPKSDRKMLNCTVFIDPDDIVHKLGGYIFFRQPICETIKAEDNHFGKHIGDHFMKNWVAFFEARQQ